MHNKGNRIKVIKIFELFDIRKSQEKNEDSLFLHAESHKIYDLYTVVYSVINLVRKFI